MGTTGTSPAAATARRQLPRSLGTPKSVLEEFDFWDGRYEARRLFSELLGTFFLVLVAVGGPMVDARSCPPTSWPS